MVLAAILLLVGQTPHKPLLDEIGIQPTGRNGYEELCQAGDILAKGMYDHLWRAEQEVFNGGEIKRSAGSELAKEIFAGRNTLERRRILVDRFAEATRLINQAAGKPIFDPRSKHDPKTLFPELRWLRFASHLMVHVAYVQRAAGDDRAATETLMRGMHIYDQTKRGPLILWLIGKVSQDFLIEELVAALPELSHGAATALERQAIDLEGRPSSVRVAFDLEYRFIEEALANLSEDEDDHLSGLFDEEDKRFVERFRALDARGKREVGELASRQVREIRRQREAWFAEGPRAWLRPPDVIRQPRGNEVAELANRLVEETMVAVDSFMIDAVAEVVRYRLMRVTGAVIRYRWEHGRLPSTLSAAVGADLAKCPLSDLPLIYQRHPEGGFTIKSPGVEKTGELSLSTRPRRGGSGTIDP